MSVPADGVDLEHLDSLGEGTEARQALVQHLVDFGSGSASEFVLHADDEVTVFRRPGGSHGA